MEMKSHLESLVDMHGSANINEFYKPRLVLSEGAAEIEVDVVDKFNHAGGAVHGSVYFKMLDDAAWYAANSLERESFLVTTSFTTYITRPVSVGVVRAIGRVVNKNKSQLIYRFTGVSDLYSCGYFYARSGFHVTARRSCASGYSVP